MTHDPLALGARTGLPDDLAALLVAIPRPDWHAHPSFGPLTRFYLDRHAMFRDLSRMMTAEIGGALDRAGERRHRIGRFASLAQIFLGELHTHHRVEDDHYFPALLRLAPRLGRGFDMLERDHQAIDARLHAFATRAGALMRSDPASETAARAMLGELDALAPLLARHLDDEEEIVIPLMLERGEAALGL